MTGFYYELKRRNVVRVVVAYVVVSWLILQFSDLILENMNAPDWLMQAIMLLLAIGLPMAVLFAWAFEMTPEGLKREKDVDRSESITHVTGRKLDRVIIGVLAIGILILLADRFLPGDTPDSIGDAAVAGGESIAVLPFVNISSDAEQEYFSDGITEEILNSLASVAELRVAGRTSSFAFKGQNRDLREIGELLGVDHILEGSVRKAGATVRITAQLIQVEDGFHLWSETYDRELTDIFAIQDEIANEILNQLKARLLHEAAPILVSKRADPQAYDLYLRAKQRLYARTQQTIESAAVLLDQAIQLDPQYAPAYAQRGITSMLLAEDGYGTLPRATAFAEGKQFVDKALELDPQLAEAWAALGLYLQNQPARLDEAIEALTRALSINPGLIDASHWLQLALADIGNIRDAQKILEQMTERDPYFTSGMFSAVSNLNQLGDEEKAQALLERYREFKPNSHAVLQADAMHHLFRGDSAASLRLAEQALQLAPDDGVTLFWVTLGNYATLQLERVAVSGSPGFKVVALDLTGRQDEAFDLAIERTDISGPHDLFDLYNRHQREQELLNYVEERWPSIDAFAADFPRDQFGYRLMANIAYAYSRTGNADGFDKSMLLLEDAMTHLAEQGADNFVTMVGAAQYHVLAGNYEQALELLDRAIDRGYDGIDLMTAFGYLFEPIREDDRYIALTAKALGNINRQRASLGLDSIDEIDPSWR